MATMELPEVTALALEISALRQEVRELREVLTPSKAWYTRAEVAEMKGVSKSALDHQTHLYPSFGQARRVGGRERFPADVVRAWLPKSDEQILREYRGMENQECRDRVRLGRARLGKSRSGTAGQAWKSLR